MLIVDKCDEKIQILLLALLDNITIVHDIEIQSAKNFIFQVYLGLRPNSETSFGFNLDVVNYSVAKFFHLSMLAQKQAL